MVGPTALWDLSEPPSDLTISLDGHPYDHPAELLAALHWPEAARLEAEVAHSVAALALARVGAASLGRHTVAFADQDLVEHEQRVVDGHRLHPCCRNRTGFRAEDHLAYGPEHRPVVALDLLACPYAPARGIRAARRWPASATDPGCRCGRDQRCPHPDLAVVLRACPTAVLRPGETILPVGALTARPPDGGCPPLCLLAATHPVAWLADFVALALPPLLTLLAWGIALEAHEQNLLLVVSQGRPRRLIYRDLADIWLCATRLKAAGSSCPAVPNRMRASSAELRAKLFSTFVATTLTGLVTTLAKHADSRRLWDTVGLGIRQTYASLPNTRATQADQHALLNEPIPAKPLTLMRINPDTTLWAYQPNPFN